MSEKSRRTCRQAADANGPAVPARKRRADRLVKDGASSPAATTDTSSNEGFDFRRPQRRRSTGKLSEISRDTYTPTSAAAARNRVQATSFDFQAPQASFSLSDLSAGRALFDQQAKHTASLGSPPTPPAPLAAAKGRSRPVKQVHLTGGANESKYPHPMDLVFSQSLPNFDILAKAARDGAASLTFEPLLPNRSAACKAGLSEEKSCRDCGATLLDNGFCVRDCSGAADAAEPREKTS